MEGDNKYFEILVDDMILVKNDQILDNETNEFHSLYFIQFIFSSIQWTRPSEHTNSPSNYLCYSILLRYTNFLPEYNWDHKTIYINSIVQTIQWSYWGSPWWVLNTLILAEYI